MATPNLPRIVQQVTRKHAAVFAEAMERYVRDQESMDSAFEDAGIVIWPAEETAQNRYVSLQSEIIELAFARFRPAVEDAFFSAATEVLDRERERRRALQDSVPNRGSKEGS
jgi:hypothetical protein